MDINVTNKLTHSSHSKSISLSKFEAFNLFIIVVSFFLWKPINITKSKSPYIYNTFLDFTFRLL